jgi:hypothetical protein
MKIYVFENNYCNLTSLTKINTLTLITHNFNDSTFHHFPISVTNFLINKIKKENIFSIKSNILFITRGKASHLPRNLSNQEEIENYLKNNNVDIFNPEQHTFEELVCILQQYNNIIITWGGALVNLSFCQLNSNITILKSKSYEHEGISLFNKIINDRNLKINIIVHVDNKIYPSTILQI